MTTRTPRRDELLEAAAAYLLRRGVADLSLRPMATAIGTSARLLDSITSEAASGC